MGGLAYYGQINRLRIIYLQHKDLMTVRHLQKIHSFVLDLVIIGGQHALIVWVYILIAV